MTDQSNPTATTLEGHLVHITFYNATNHFAIARFKENTSGSTISILGHLPDPNLGENLRIDGAWQHHPKYGAQFRIERFEILLPETPDGIRKYLLSAHINGIGPKMATRIIKQFGEQSLEIIENPADHGFMESPPHPAQPVGIFTPKWGGSILRCQNFQRIWCRGH